MGVLKNLLGLFIARKAMSRNPLYEMVLTEIQKEIHESPHELIQMLSKEQKEKIILEICNAAETIWQAPDRVLANREKLLECMLTQVHYEILMIEPGNELCGFHGISGKLKGFLPEFAQKEIESGGFVWRQERKPTKEEAYNLAWGIWWKAHLYCKILNEIRIYLKDYNTNLERDWYFPLHYALAAFEEYTFRKEYGLTQIIEGLCAMQYSTFLQVISQGHKDPLAEWEKTYNEVFPVPIK
jgi:hypothetical protein